MKKFLALMLAVLMLLSMATVAMADTTWNISGIENGGTFDLTLAYTNAAYAPDETFDFSISIPTDATNPTTEVPTIQTKPSVSNGMLSNTITVKLPMYSKVGTYEYTMQEITPENPSKGVTYDSDARTLKVYVENDENGFMCQVALYHGENKSDTFTNEYEMGTVRINKTVDSTVSVDKDKSYSFEITLSNVNDVDYKGYIIWSKDDSAVTGTQEVTISGTTKTEFTLRDGQTLKIEHLPKGASYTVTETEPTADASHNGTVTVKYDNTTATYDEDGTPTNSASGAINQKNSTVSSTVANNFSYKGDLVVKKVVTGNLGDETKWFSFTVTNITSSIEVEFADSSKVKDYGFGQDGNYTFKMQHNGQVTFKNIPYDVVCTVSEVADGYDSTKTVAQYFKNDVLDNNASTMDNGKMDHAKEVVTFTNENDQEIPTGVALDTLPYVLVLALAGAGLVLMIARKRRVED